MQNILERNKIKLGYRSISVISLIIMDLNRWQKTCWGRSLTQAGKNTHTQTITYESLSWEFWKKSKLWMSQRWRDCDRQLMWSSRGNNWHQGWRTCCYNYIGVGRRRRSPGETNVKELLGFFDLPPSFQWLKIEPRLKPRHEGWPRERGCPCIHINGSV